MSNIRKNIYLTACFFITIIIAIFNLFSASYTGRVAQELIEVASGSRNQHTSWDTAIFIITIFIVFVAALTMIFNYYHSKQNINKKLQVFLLVINIVLTIITIFLLLLVCLRYSKYEYKLAVNENIEIIERNNYICDGKFIQIFLILLVECVSNIVLSIVSCLVCNSQNSESIEDSTNEKEEDESQILKSNIEKVKKQIELEDLRAEYSSLLKQVKAKKNVSQD